MGIRKRIARTSEDILTTDYNEALKKAKTMYRGCNEFYIFKVQDNSDFWSAMNYMLNPNKSTEHWMFENKRWVKKEM